MEKLKLDTLEKLHRLLPGILKKINDNNSLALAAAANPLYAIEELGYRLDPQLRAQLEDHVRFKPGTVAKLAQLRKEIYRLAGHSFDLNSASELHELLFAELKLPHLHPKSAKKPPPHLELTAPLAPQVDWGLKTKDPLEKWRGQHPILEPLLAYRRLEAGAPRLADQELYQEIRRGSRATPARRIRFVAQRTHT